MRKPKQPVVSLSRIIIDSRDARKDVFAPTKLCQALFDKHELSVDTTNSINERAYCLNDMKGPLPKAILHWLRTGEEKVEEL